MSTNETTTKPAPTLIDLYKQVNRALGRATMAIPCDERLCDDLRAALETIDDMRIAADRAEMGIA